MFKNAITQTALTTPFADKYFRRKIYGDSFARDWTFISTLRALVTPRMKDDEKIVFCINSTTPGRGDAQEIARMSTKSFEDFGNGIIWLTNLQSNDSDRVDRHMKAIEDNFEAVNPGYCRVVKVTDFFRKVFKVLCYVNVEKKSVFIITDNLDLRKYHFLQIGIFAFLPWYFNPEDGVNDLEMDLINSLREKTSEKYELAIEKLAAQYDLRTAGIRSMLDGFELRYEQICKDRTLREIEHIVAQINDLNERIGSYLEQKRNADNILFGLDMKLASSNGDSEIMEYFIRNKRLSLMSVDDTTIEFVVKEYLTFFDEEMAKTAIDNTSSYIYRPGGRMYSDTISAADMKTLMYAVFVDQKIKMRVCAAYRFRLEGGVSAIARYDYGSEFRDYMPNVHIDRYSCLGGYERQINTFLASNDYIGAIEQCVASCRSLNFGDGAVMREFMMRLYGVSDYQTNVRCFELPDGSVVDPKGAIKYLKGENNNG